MIRAIQYTQTATSRTEAEQMFSFLETQVDYLGGRILRPGPGRPGWSVQVFFRDDLHPDAKWLPDGCRRVSIPNGLAASLGIQE